VADLHQLLRDDLSAALRARDRDTVRVLRTVLSAVANAEAQPDHDATPLSLRSEGVIAGAADGVAAAEVARRDLGEQEVRAVVQAERAERLAAADDLAARGAVDAAEALRAEATLLERYVD
jgi:uncharacterized protein YqeY